ncbi:hypothetical protein [Streptomyces sp. NPDC093970]|uniref:hypothetical protein n=1 Tax=Streptomyces sp. NPDC093970 TaxID=3155076 RepID=UPI00341B012A
MTVEERTPAWRGGSGRLWTAAVVSRSGDALRTSALPPPAARPTDAPLALASVTAIAAALRTSSTSGAPPGALLGGAVAGAWGPNGPALLAPAVTSLIPVRRPDVPVVAPRDGGTAGRAPS